MYQIINPVKVEVDNSTCTLTVSTDADIMHSVFVAAIFATADKVVEHEKAGDKYMAEMFKEKLEAFRAVRAEMERVMEEGS